MVADAKQAYEASVANGAIGVQPPTNLRDEAEGTEQIVAEVSLYGDCVLRFVSGNYQVSLAQRIAFPFYNKTAMSLEQHSQLKSFAAS